MKKKHTITQQQILKMHAKANRETMHSVKPIVTTDKKKKAAKNSCRNYKYTR